VKFFTSDLRTALAITVFVQKPRTLFVFLSGYSHLFSVKFFCFVLRMFGVDTVFFKRKMLGTRYEPVGPDLSDSRDPVIIFSNSRDPIRVPKHL